MAENQKLKYFADRITNAPLYSSRLDQVFHVSKNILNTSVLTNYYPVCLALDCPVDSQSLGRRYTVTEARGHRKIRPQPPPPLASLQDPRISWQQKFVQNFFLFLYAFETKIRISTYCSKVSHAKASQPQLHLSRLRRQILQFLEQATVASATPPPNTSLTDKLSNCHKMGNKAVLQSDKTDENS